MNGIKKIVLLLLLCGLMFCVSSTFWEEGGLYSSEKERLENVIYYYTMKIDSDKTNSDLYFKRGENFFLLQEYSKAIVDYTKAIKLDKKYASYYVSRGIAYMLLDQYNKSLEDFNKAIELDSQLKYVHNNRGLLFLEMKKYQEALKDFTFEIEVNNYQSALVNRSYYYLENHMWNEAINDGKKIIENDKMSLDGYKITFLANYELQNFEEAKKATEEIVKLNPENSRAYFVRGKCLHQLGNLVGAIADYSKSIEIKSDDCEVYSYRSQAYQLLAELTSNYEEKDFYLQKSLADYNYCQ